MRHILALYALSPLFEAVFWTSYLAWIGSELWIFSRDRRAATGHPVDRGSRRFIVLMFAIGVVGGFIWANRSAWGRIGFDPRLVFWIGIALMWAGLLFRFWAVRTLGRFFRTSVQVLDDHALVTTGPYKVLRNPSYAGSMITLAGIGVALGTWPSLALAVVFPLVGYVRRIAVEDAALRGRFGPAYEDYRRRTWALVPLVW